MNSNVAVLPWPSKSPGLNPIKHLLDDIDRRVRQRQPQPQSLQQLVNALQDGTTSRNKQFEL
jgi:transposase